MFNYFYRMQILLTFSFASTLTKLLQNNVNFQFTDLCLELWIIFYLSLTFWLFYYEFEIADKCVHYFILFRVWESAWWLGKSFSIFKSWRPWSWFSCKYKCPFYSSLSLCIYIPLIFLSILMKLYIYIPLIFQSNLIKFYCIIKGVYNENPSVVYHTGYGYSPQMPYGPYSPVATPLPSISGDGQLYSTQQFQYQGAYYQQPSPPSMPYLSSPTPIPQSDWTMPIDQQGAFTADTSNFNPQLFGPRPGYQVSYGSFGRGSTIIRVTILFFVIHVSVWNQIGSLDINQIGWHHQMGQALQHHYYRLQLHLNRLVHCLLVKAPHL